MIHIGNQSAYSAATPTEPFEYAVTRHFDAFEWFPDKKADQAGWDENDLDEPRRRSIRQTALDRGLRLSVHARWQANPLREDSTPLFQKDLELARDVGAALLNIHLYTDRGLAAYVESILPLARQAAEAGLQLSIENTPEHSPEDFNELFERLRAVDSLSTRRVGMCLDLGHANLCAATRNEYLKFFDRLDPRVPIIHLHLHENWGDADRHLPLFTGPAGRDDSGVRGILERLRRRNFSGSIILEQWPQPPALLDQARDRLLGLLKLEADPAQPSSGVFPDPAAEGTIFETPVSRIVPDRSGARSGEAGRGREHNDGREQNDFADALVAADRRCKSWREKLDFVHGLLAGETTPLRTEQLVDIAIYLRFLGTGQVQCAEDGRHFRPAHHARIALQIQERLAKLSGPDTAWIARKIHPWLPSSSRAFQRAEPLTRIRDIAHRNDIPADLKREIKHSLQNKLHRCAGPEDLATSAALLERITSPGANYSSAFVEQFRVFHEELKEFFNARSLDERLNALLPRVDAPEAGIIRSFLREKAGTTLSSRLNALRFLTELRRACLELAGKNPRLESQELLLADIGLEDFAFVLLSEIISALDVLPIRTGELDPVSAGARTVPDRSGLQKTEAIPHPGASLSSLLLRAGTARGPASADAWMTLLDTLLLTVANLAMSRIEPEECGAIESELRVWRQVFDPSEREQLLRLKATTDRARRVAEDYSDRVMALFPGRVERLGSALGVAEHAIRVFCDAEIRGSLVFQLSRLVSSLLRRVREKLDLPAWDVVVTGRAVGCVKVASRLEELGQDCPEPVVVLLQKAEGDEEIPRGIAGIVLGHDIPHLSHLGVRARQAGVVFVTSEEEERLQELRRLQGQSISLTATADKVGWERAGGPGFPEGRRDPVRPQAVRLAPERPWIPLEQVVAENGGGKAAGARRLAELARRDGAGFKTPTALAVPFGVMEAAFLAAPSLEAERRQLLSRIEGLTPPDFTNAAKDLRGLIQRLTVPGEIAAAVASKFGEYGRLIVRSSANCEDSEELAGAGLYESIANVAPSDVLAAVRAVWASLWTQRAAVSRRRAGIPQDQAHMAVLIEQMLTPDFSFVLHTVNPINQHPREVYAEIAVGFGETLASAAARGSPYRLVCDKTSGETVTLALASFSQALWPQPGGGWLRKTVDYSRVPLSRECHARVRLGRRVAAIGRWVEDAFQGPQDIEGVVVADEIYLVQARPQQGLGSRDKS